MTSSDTPPRLGTTVAERLTSFARTLSNEGPDRAVGLACGHVALTLRFLEFGVEDFEAGRDEFLEDMERQRVWISMSMAERANEDSAKLYEARTRSNYLVQYRVDAFLVFARMLLDDLVVLIDRVFPSPTEIGSHSNLKKNLPKLIDHHGLETPSSLLERADALGRHVDYRDDYVIHRSRKTLRATRGIAFDLTRSRANVNIGWRYPRDTDPQDVVESGYVPEIHKELLDYVAEVLDFTESKLRDTAPEERGATTIAPW